MKTSRFRQIHTLKGWPFRENKTPNLKPSPFHQIHSNQSWLSWTIQPDQITCKNENGDDHDGQLIVWSGEMAKNGDFYAWNEQPEHISSEQRRICPDCHEQSSLIKLPVKTRMVAVTTVN